MSLVYPEQGQTSYLDAPPGPPRPRQPFRERELRRLAVGVHPSGVALLAFPLCGRCGNCGHREAIWTDDGLAETTHHKCALMRENWTRGRATDVLLRWPACARWVPRTGDRDQ